MQGPHTARLPCLSTLIPAAPVQGLTNLCLSADPEQRPSAKELQRALHRFARTESAALGRDSTSKQLQPKATLQAPPVCTGCYAQAASF